MALSGTADIELARSERMDRHTSYRLGGPADLFCICHSTAALSKAVEVLDRENVRWVVMGRGSNILVSDEGFPGCVIQLGREFSRLSFQEDGHVVAGAAVSLPKMVNHAMREGLSGLERLVGVPGSLGGALCMNAGTRDEWICDVVESVVVFRPGSGLVRYGVADISWGYRSCSIPAGEVILEAVLALTPKESARISRDMEHRLVRKRATQPLTEASCGSVFRNPEDGPSVASLVEQLGLKGYSVGGAHVSPKHANFIVNDGSASASDVLAVIEHVHEQVKEGYDVDLQTEVRFLGFA